MVRPGIMDPVSSAEFIAKNSEFVTIQIDGINKLADEILKNYEDGILQIPETGRDLIGPSKKNAKAVDWVFFLDALNFCFWSNGNPWTVDGHTGYYALEAAIAKELKKNEKIINPEYYSKITLEELTTIFTTEDNRMIPILDKRLEVLHEVGNVLLEKYNGTFENCIKKCEKSAPKLLELVINEFPCFRDECDFKGKRVAFYKRAQILVSDLYETFNGQGFGELKGMDSLTMFADYRVPQVLVYFDVLKYTDELYEKLMKNELLPYGSDEETEIRGCSIHAVELIKERLRKKIAENNLSLATPTACQIDYFLWCYRRKYAKDIEKSGVPFHKTLSIFY